jgi:hypothetical protein
MSDWLIALVLWGWAILELAMLPKRWRTPIGVRPFRVPSYWRWGSAAWFGLQRAQTVAPVWLGAGGIFLLSHWLWAGLAWLVALGVHGLLFATRRPAILVPPALRNQAALLDRFG